MKKMPIFPLLLAPLALLACAKASPEAPAHTRNAPPPEELRPTVVLADIGAPNDRAEAADVPGMPSDPNAPPPRNTSSPDESDRVGPERTGLPSSRTDAGGAPKPLPPGVTLDGGSL